MGNLCLALHIDAPRHEALDAAAEDKRHGLPSASSPTRQGAPGLWTSRPKSGNSAPEAENTAGRMRRRGGGRDCPAFEEQCAGAKASRRGDPGRRRGQRSTERPSLAETFPSQDGSPQAGLASGRMASMHARTRSGARRPARAGLRHPGKRKATDSFRSIQRKQWEGLGSSIGARDGSDSPRAEETSRRPAVQST